MIVRQFLHWVRTAPAADRADATGALVRAYLYSDLTVDDRAAVQGALLMLLDDPSPMIRKALAQAIAHSELAPMAIVHGLVIDQPDIAAVIYEYSPLLTEADLVEGVGTTDPQIQAAIARRMSVSRVIAAALAEVGSAEACLTLLENPGAVLQQGSLDRIVERHGHLGAVRETILDRDDIPATTRQALIAKLSDTLAGFVTAREWMAPDHARRVTKEACEKATVSIAAQTSEHEIHKLIHCLRENGQLTAGLVLRALLSGNVALFEEALAELSGMPLTRVCGLIYAKGHAGLRAVFDKAGLPNSTYPAFRAAIDTIGEGGFVGDQAGASRLKRRMVERVLTRCEQELSSDVEPMLILLRRYVAEAAREEARLFCDELVTLDGIETTLVQRLAAAA